MNEDSKTQYRAWCGQQAALPLFFQDWWLDAACRESGSWDVCLSRGGEPMQVRGVLPYFRTRRYGVSWISPPPLTPFLGPWLVYPEAQKPDRRHSFEAEVLEDLARQLPPVTFLVQRWPYQAANWLPFYWRGFAQQTQYSYVIEPLLPLEDVFAGFRGAVRTEIRKAESVYEVERGADTEDLHDLVGQVFSRQGKKMPFPGPWLAGLYEAAAGRAAGRIYYARKAGAGRPEAAIFVVWDRESAYLLLTGRAGESAGGAVSLLIWRAMQDLAPLVKRFDFEGSMLRRVEVYFRGFGGDLRSYFRVCNSNYAFAQAMGRLFRGLNAVNGLRK